MRLSAPIYRLKRHARQLSKDQGLALHDALDQIAQREGFRSWSLLARKAAETGPAQQLITKLLPGELLLLAARPQQGKTLLSLELVIAAVQRGGDAHFFSLEYAASDVHAALAQLGTPIETLGERLTIDVSDSINAAYVAEQLQSARPGTLVVLDYLQALDQKRTNPELATQVAALKALAKQRDLVIACISQVDRRYDPTTKPLPDIADIRLPNPVDLSAFSKMCFLHDGELHLTAS